MRVKHLIAYYECSKVFDTQLNEESRMLIKIINKQLQRERSVAVFSLPEISMELINRIQNVIDEWERL